MQRTEIEWTKNKDGSKGYTWNPSVGCLNGCSYCYARQIATRFAGTKAFPNGFTPTWHPERLDEPLHLKKPSRIFVGSMGDYFGDWVSHTQFDQILEVIDCCPQHTFYMLTKQPQNIMKMLYETNEGGNFRYLGGNDYIPNLWLGASVTDNAMAQRTKPHMIEVGLCGWHTFVSIEPILGYINPFNLTWSEWTIIGAMSGKDAAKHVPERKWVEDIVNVAVADHVPVFLKDSLMPMYADLSHREWPEQKDE